MFFCHHFWNKLVSLGWTEPSNRVPIILNLLLIKEKEVLEIYLKVLKVHI